MDTLWLLYDEADLAVNLGFVDLMRDRGRVRGLNIVPVTTQELTLGMDASGAPVCLRAGVPARPRAVLSRQRDSLISFHFERMGVACVQWRPRVRHLQRQARHAPVSQRSAHARNRLFTRHSLSASTG